MNETRNHFKAGVYFLPHATMLNVFKFGKIVLSFYCSLLHNWMWVRYTGGWRQAASIIYVRVAESGEKTLTSLDSFSVIAQIHCFLYLPDCSTAPKHTSNIVTKGGISLSLNFLLRITPSILMIILLLSPMNVQPGVINTTRVIPILPHWLLTSV